MFFKNILFSKTCTAGMLTENIYVQIEKLVSENEIYFTNATYMRRHSSRHDVNTSLTKVVNIFRGKKGAVTDLSHIGAH